MSNSHEKNSAASKILSSSFTSKISACGYINTAQNVVVNYEEFFLRAEKMLDLDEEEERVAQKKWILPVHRGTVAFLYFIFSCTFPPFKVVYIEDDAILYPIILEFSYLVSVWIIVLAGVWSKWYVKVTVDREVRSCQVIESSYRSISTVPMLFGQKFKQELISCMVYALLCCNAGRDVQRSVFEDK